MFDTRNALHDMAHQIRACRVEDELTLQMLATRSGVAASTIHKVESERMVPTISVFLKIAKGLGKRPDELIRDLESRDAEAQDGRPAETIEADSPREETPTSTDGVGVWRIELDARNSLPDLELDPLQRAIVLVECGSVRLVAGNRLISLEAGDCIAIDGGRIHSSDRQADPARLTLIVSPPGDLGRSLGEPTQSSPIYR